MKTITAVIEYAGDNYSAYVEGFDGIAASGATLDEIKGNLSGAVEAYIEACRDLGCKLPEDLSGEYEISFRMDVKSFLGLYTGIFTKSGLERLTGINQKQLWHYAQGLSTPRRAQVQRIEQALHQLGKELIAIHL